MDEYPESLWALLELLAECERRYNAIPVEYHNALWIGRDLKWIETSSTVYDGPSGSVEAVAVGSRQAYERLAAFAESKNPSYWLSSKGRLNLAMHREKAKEPSNDSTTPPAGIAWADYRYDGQWLTVTVAKELFNVSGPDLSKDKKAKANARPHPEDRSNKFVYTYADVSRISNRKSRE